MEIIDGDNSKHHKSTIQYQFPPAQHTTYKMTNKDVVWIQN